MALPPELARSLRPALPGLAEATVAAIGREVPDYARPLEGPFGDALRLGVDRALTRFVDGIEDPAGVVDDGGALAVELGRGEHRAGRPLDALLSAYRLGARLAWERFVAAAEADGVAPKVLYALAGAIFSYIDAISAGTVAGYADEQSREAGERSRRRRALLRALAGGEDVGTLAAEVGWPLPTTLAGLVATGPGAVRALARLGPDVLVELEPGDRRTAVAVVADPGAPGRLVRLRALAGGLTAALGPTVRPTRSALTLARARATHDLALEGRLTPSAAEAGAGAPTGLLVADEHLVALLLHGDPALAADLARRELAPLEGLAAGPRARLTETLAAWLDHPGQPQRIAARLGVHPQTVRYRVAQLRDLCGDALDDPDRRFALALALRAR